MSGFTPTLKDAAVEYEDYNAEQAVPFLFQVNFPSLSQPRFFFCMNHILIAELLLGRRSVCRSRPLQPHHGRVPQRGFVGIEF